MYFFDVARRGKRANLRLNFCTYVIRISIRLIYNYDAFRKNKN